MVKLGKRIHSYGTSPPKSFASKTRCHIDPTVHCYSKEGCATCKIAKKHKQQFLIQPKTLKKPKKTKRKNNPNNPTSTSSAEVTDETQKQVMCAYCLHTGPLNQFLISTKKGFHHSQTKCPDCQNGQLMRTLIDPMTPDQYAEFIYSQKQYGVWQKMPFEKWRQRLIEIGWAPQFWARYNELKAQDISSDDFTRRDREAYEEFTRKYGEEE